MHTLIYNGVNLSNLGVELEMLGQSSVLEPPEAPQYRRTSLRCRFTFFEPTWEDNYGLITQLRDALKSQQGVLQWKDDDGNPVVNRRVIVGPNDLPDINSQGQYRQAVNFSFQYLEFPATDGIVPNTLAATYQVQGGPIVKLSVVEHWTEGLDTKTYSEWRPDRRRVGGTVSASGKILGNSLAALPTSQQGLFAAKDFIVAQILSSDQGTLIYGSFSQAIRGVKFDAVVDQAQDLIRWTLHGEFTRLPSEGNYAQADIGVEMRDQPAQGAQGITEIILSGKIESDSATHAYSALAEFQLGMIPPDYTLIETADTERILEGMDSPGGTFLELTVREVYRQNKTGLVTWTGDDDGPTQTLGICEHFSDAYEGQLFSELRPQRQRAGGAVQMTGRYQLGPDDEISTLYETMEGWLALMTTNKSGQLSYGTVFEQDVRIISFVPQVNEGIRAITWTLTAHFTRFPNESGYAVCDFRVKTSAINTEGAVEVTLTGKIEAQSEEAALAALAGIRSTAVPAGYVTMEQDKDSRNVIADSDGATFIELSFAERYRLTQGQILTWTFKQLDSADTKTGMIRSVFSGTITAIGATLGQAYAAGAAQAQTLGAGKYPMLMRSDITQTQKLFLTSGVFVEVEFLYEYLRKGTLTYIEATAEVTKDAFGQDVQVVSGYAAGPTNAACRQAYLANVRNTSYRQGLLLLAEKNGFSHAQITTPGGATLDVRFDFVLTLHRPKDATETAMSYSIMVRQNFIELTQTTAIEGTVYAGSAAIAQASLTAFLSTAAPAGAVQPEAVTRQRAQTGNNIGGNPQTDFFALEFNSTFMSVMTGAATVLESELTVDVTFAGIRWVEQPIPGTISLMQNTGIKPGNRRVTGRVKAATEAAALNWAQAQHAYISGGFEEQPQLALTYDFLPLTVGVAEGAGANVRVYIVTFTFSERLPSLFYGG